MVAKYDLTLDLAEASAIARRPEIRQGVLQATGEGSWSSPTFSSSGKLLVKNFNWRDESLGLRGAALSGDYTVNPQRLSFLSAGGEAVGRRSKWGR